MTITLGPDGWLAHGPTQATLADVREMLASTHERVADAVAASAQQLRIVFNPVRILLGGPIMWPDSGTPHARMVVCVTDSASIDTGMLADDNRAASLITTMDALLTYPGGEDFSVRELRPVGGLVDTEVQLDHLARRSQMLPTWLGGDSRGYLEVI